MLKADCLCGGWGSCRERETHHTLSHSRAMESSMQTMQKRWQASEFPQGTHTRSLRQSERRQQREWAEREEHGGLAGGTCLPGYVADDTDFNNERHIARDEPLARAAVSLELRHAPQKQTLLLAAPSPPPFFDHT